MSNDEKQVILIVDDNPIIQEFLKGLLAKEHEVWIAESGGDCLMLLETAVPDLILLDIEMPGMDGYETCRRIRERLDIPVIFVSASGGIDERLRAFEAGGDDFIAKPFNADLLQYKVARILLPHRRVEALMLEKQTMRQMSADLLDIAGENRILLEFMQDNLGCQHHEDLYRGCQRILKRFGLVGQIEFRLPTGNTRLSIGEYALSPLEDSLLANGGVEPGVFLYKNRLLIHSPNISLLITNFPGGTDLAARMQDYLNTLVQTTESLIQTISVKRDSAAATESLQVAALGAHDAMKDLLADYHRQQADTRLLLHGLIEKVERAYYSLGLTEGQEERISRMLREETDAVMELFQRGSNEFEGKFANVMEVLVPTRKDHGDVWL